jgi:hypothetical protein
LHSVLARRVADRACQVIARLPQRRDFAQDHVCSGDCVCRAAYTPYCRLVPRLGSEVSTSVTLGKNYFLLEQRCSMG